MLKIRRLNMDSSWQITWAGQSLLIDPWLIGAETDFSRYFNKQWHVTPPAQIDSLEHFDAVLISQHFSDHCHEETLKKLDPGCVLTTPKGAQRIRKTISKENIRVIADLSSDHWTKQGDLEICLLPAAKKLKASFNGIIIRHQNQIIMYCPHGYELTTIQLQLLKAFETVLLMTSFSTFKLPFFLGGAVNPGMEQAQKLIQATQPKFLLAAHDEDKHASGLIKKMAQVSYPSVHELTGHFPDQFIDLYDTNKTMEIPC
jgi:hypothetical protein